MTRERNIPLFFCKKGFTFCSYDIIICVATKREVIVMSPMGRPKSESPKDTMLRVRLDEEYREKLDRCSNKLNISKSEVVRAGIDLVEKSIEQK